MKIAVLGCGIVGSAVADGMERLGHEVFRHDPIKYNTRIASVIKFEPQIAFVCVPTPSKCDGSCDTSIVESVVNDLTSRAFRGIIAIKSTVEPGTTKRLWEKYSSRYYSGHVLKMAFVPEFLRERSAFYDFTEGHDLCAIGVYNGAPVKYAEEIFDIIKKAHGHYPKSFAMMSWTEAELVKYFSNVFNALRITFANGFHDVCKALGADYTKIKNAVVSRGTVKNMYLDCNENFRGFGGQCLTKDSSAFSHLAAALGVEAKIFQTIIEDNALYKVTVFEGMRK